ncbi:hypothetical protein ACFQH8_13905 [Halomicroarcula sp. GCM10025710]
MAPKALARAHRLPRHVRDRTSGVHSATRPRPAPGIRRCPRRRAGGGYRRDGAGWRRGVRAYLRDDIAVCILECEDLDAYLEAVDGDEEVAEWERYTGQFKREGVDADADPESGIPFMDCIWRFEPEE